MPRAQKHPYATRYQLEKLRLDVALKRARVAALQKESPARKAPLPYDPEVEAITAETLDAERELRRLQAREALAFRRDMVARKAARLQEREENR